MVHFPKIALWRGWPSFAVSPLHESKAKQLPKGLPDHLARDIGLSKTDQERVNFEWPSQSNKRPML